VPIVIALIDLVVVTALVARGLDVRMLLLLGALPLFLVTGGLRAMVVKIASEMVNAGTVVPICSAMGFAYVLRLTECDQHLVRLLTRPLHRVRVLLVPGGIAAGYLINTTIVSQAGTAAVLGPILVPLLRAGGLGAVSAGAILLLGSSMGGELFNPGSVEMRKLAELTGTSGAAVVAGSARFNLLACATALAAFWYLGWRRGEDRERNPDAVAQRHTAEHSGQPMASAARTEPRPLGPVVGDAPEPDRINFAKAMVPVLPIVLLSLDAAFGHFVFTSSSEGPTRILAAMLIGVVAAGLTSLDKVGGASAVFFEGAGFAYTHVISLIVVASTFAAAIERSGLIEIAIRAIAPWPSVALVVATAAPWGLAMVSGTGIAPAVAIMEFFVPVAGTMGIEPIRLGTLTAMGAHFGRTMSPAAAVVMMSSRLSGARSSDLIRRVAVPLLAGGTVLMAAALLGLV
jgi:DcuC family C4-dicarboxylate transporter